MDELFSNFFQNKKIIITGGSGFIGQKLINYLCNYNVQILNIVRNKNQNIVSKKVNSKILNFENIAKYQKNFNECDFFFHLAFENSLRISENNPKKHRLSNVNNLKKFIENTEKFKKKINLIFPSTASIFGIQNKLPVGEKALNKPITFYDKHKLECEQLLNQSNYIKQVSLRLPNIYGFSQYAINVPDRNIINKIIESCIYKKRIDIYGTGEYIRDYFYIDDLIEAFLYSTVYIDKLSKHSFLVIGSEKGTSVNDCFKTIADIVEKKLKLNIKINYLNNENTMRSIDKRNYIANSKLFKNITSWKPKTSFIEGINKTILETINAKKEN